MGIGTDGGDDGGHWRAYPEAYRDPLAATYTTNVGAVATSPARVHTQGFSIEDAGIRTGEIIAYRAWAINSRGLLASMYAKYVWAPKTIERADNLNWHGLHAFKTMEQAVRHYKCYGVWGWVVFGTVELWGEVIEHHRGYRAEYAAIVSLDRAYKFGARGRERGWQLWRKNVLAPLRDRYGVSGAVITNGQSK